MSLGKESNLTTADFQVRKKQKKTSNSVENGNSIDLCLKGNMNY